MENDVLGGKKLVAFVVTTACLFAIASMAAKSISEQSAENQVSNNRPALNLTLDTTFFSIK